MDYSEIKDFVLDASSFVRIMASNDYLRLNNGAKLDLYSSSIQNTAEENGSFKLSAKTKNNGYIDLIGDGEGNLTWNGVPLTTGTGGGTTDYDSKYLALDGSNRMKGYVLSDKDSEVFRVGYHYGNKEGSSIIFYSANHADNPGGFVIDAISGDNKYSLSGKTDGTLSWNGKTLATLKDLENLTVGGGGKRGVGEQWISMDGTIPEGGIPFNGQILLKADYPELCDWITANNRWITESEWQTRNTSNNGNVNSYSNYSSTQFRMPIFRGYLKAHQSGGTYIKQGLPNHNHTITSGSDITVEKRGNISKISMDTISDYNPSNTYNFLSSDASLSNSIYGASSNVTPETNTILVGVYAWSIVVGGSTLDAGSDIISNINISISKPDINIGYPYKDATGSLLALRSVNYTNNPGGFELFAKDATNQITLKGTVDGSLTWEGKQIITLVKYWKNGANWYKKYSDGWIEQGGSIEKNGENEIKITYHLPFKDVNYFFSRSAYGQSNSANLSYAYSGCGYDGEDTRTTTTNSFRSGPYCIGYIWYACGY